MPLNRGARPGLAVSRDEGLSWRLAGGTVGVPAGSVFTEAAVIDVGEALELLYCFRVEAARQGRVWCATSADGGAALALDVKDSDSNTSGIFH
jgi:hypothetical protein